MGLFFGRSKGSRGGDSEPTPPEGERRDESSVDESTLLLTGDELRDRRSIGLLLESIAEVTSTIDLAHLLENIVDNSIALTRAERGVLLLCEGGSTEAADLQVHVARTNTGEDLPKSVRYSTHVVSEVMNSGRPTRTMVRSDAEALDLSRSVFDLKLRAVMCTPLRVGDEILGVIYVDSRAATREFSRTDLAFFDALSRQIAIALTNARLVEENLQKTRMEQQLRIAGEIQRGLLPNAPPRCPGLELHGWYVPCDEATGDYYDFVPLAGGRLAVVVGDASGHGIGPALISSSARAMMRAYLQALPDLSAVVGCVNRDLQRDLDDGMFMTLFVAVVDPRERTLTYVSAGHTSAALIAPDGTLVELDSTGLALGLMEDEVFEASEPRVLEPGTLLFAFTDGIVEARRSDGTLFGEERLYEALREGVHHPLPELMREVAERVDRFQGGPQEDDQTAVAVKFVAAEGASWAGS